MAVIKTCKDPKNSLGSLLSTYYYIGGGLYAFANTHKLCIGYVPEAKGGTVDYYMKSLRDAPALMHGLPSEIPYKSRIFQ